MASRGRDLWRTAWLLKGDSHKAGRVDNVQLYFGSCGELNFISWAGETYLLRVDRIELLG